MDKVICVVGPTASGKTALGVALAKRFDGEVISADSMQIYKGMNIGTAKPTKEEMYGVPHHMLDVCGLEENYSVARYVQEADACLVDIIFRGKLPIIVGGTGLYMDALIAGREFSSVDESGEIRRQLERQAADEGIDAVREILKNHDSDSYFRLHPNDEKRIIRAAEVYIATGKTISQHNLETASLPPKYKAITIGLSFENRAELYARIDRRVDIMLQSGLLAEVKALSSKYGKTTAMQAIGYKEFSQYLAGEMSLDAAVDKVKQESRRYAKRQLTWLRRKSDIFWLTLSQPIDFDAVVLAAEEYARKKLAET